MFSRRSDAHFSCLVESRGLGITEIRKQLAQSSPAADPGKDFASH